VFFNICMLLVSLAALASILFGRTGGRAATEAAPRCRAHPLTEILRRIDSMLDARAG
jgi:hypothetical protein